MNRVTAAGPHEAAIGPAESPAQADESPLTAPGRAGTYSDPWYGDVFITPEMDGLVILFSATPVLVGDLEHWQYDTFVARWHQRDLRADAFVTFDLEPDGSIAGVRMEPVSPATDFSFDFHDLRLAPKAVPAETTD